MLPLLVRRPSAESQSKPCDLEPDPSAFRLSHFPWEKEAELGNVFSSLRLFGK